MGQQTKGCSDHHCIILILIPSGALWSRVHQSLCAWEKNYRKNANKCDSTVTKTIGDGPSMSLIARLSTEVTIEGGFTAQHTQ